MGLNWNAFAEQALTGVGNVMTWNYQQAQEEQKKIAEESRQYQTEMKKQKELQRMKGDAQQAERTRKLEEWRKMNPGKPDAEGIRQIEGFDFTPEEKRAQKIADNEALVDSNIGLAGKQQAAQIELEIKDYMARTGASEAEARKRIGAKYAEGFQTNDEKLQAEVNNSFKKAEMIIAQGFPNLKPGSKGFQDKVNEVVGLKAKAAKMSDEQRRLWFKDANDATESWIEKQLETEDGEAALLEKYGSVEAAFQAKMQSYLKNMDPGSAGSSITPSRVQFYVDNGINQAQEAEVIKNVAEQEGEEKAKEIQAEFRKLREAKALEGTEDAQGYQGQKRDMGFKIGPWAKNLWDWMSSEMETPQEKKAKARGQGALQGN